MKSLYYFGISCVDITINKTIIRVNAIKSYVLKIDIHIYNTKPKKLVYERVNTPFFK